MFFEPSQFEAARILEANWQPILEDLQSLSDTSFIPWKETKLYSTGWDVFGFYAFGTRVEENCVRCSRTAEILATIPGLYTAGFSSMKPGTHIIPHRGYTYQYAPDGTLEKGDLNQGVLRCHLGLIIPPAITNIGCAFRVENEIENWQQGKCLVFDDTMEHEAWNRTEGTRVVLLIDFAPEHEPKELEALSVSQLA